MTRTSELVKGAISGLIAVLILRVLMLLLQ